MTSRRYRFVLEWAHHAGVVTAFFSLFPVIWSAVHLLGLPRPGNESAGQIAMVVAVIAYFFYAAFAYGKLAMKLAQRRVRGDCSRCRQPKADLDLGPFWRPPFKVDTLLNHTPMICKACSQTESVKRDCRT